MAATIKLSDIFLDDDLQPRARINDEAMDEYAYPCSISKASREKKNVHCPLCCGMVRYLAVRPGGGNLKLECENPNCTWTTDFLRRDKKPLSSEIRMKHWEKFGRRCG